MLATCWIAAKYSSLEVVAVVRVLWWWRSGFGFESVFRMSFAKVCSIAFEKTMKEMFLLKEVMYDYMMIHWVFD